jgi:hypothetical protein
MIRFDLTKIAEGLKQNDDYLLNANYAHNREKFLTEPWANQPLFFG